jgi:hypothetical protein
MYMQLIADGQDISRFKGEHVSAACAYIAHSVVYHGRQDHNVVAQCRYNKEKRSGSIRSASARCRDAAQAGGRRMEDGIQLVQVALAQENAVGDMEITTAVHGTTQAEPHRQVIREDLEVPDIYDTDQYDLLTSVESLQRGEWVTSRAIDRYLHNLVNSTRGRERGMKAIPANWMQQGYNFDTDAYLWTPESIADMKERVGEANIVLLPIPRPQHWALVSVYIRENKMDYLDSLYTDGDRFLLALRELFDKIAQTEDGCNARRSWRMRTSVHSSYGLGNHLLLNRQVGGNDCGVYLCMYADLISRERAVTLAGQSMVDEARERICRSILGSDAHHLTGQDEQTSDDGNGSHVNGTIQLQGVLNTACQRHSNLIVVFIKM